MKTEIMDTSYYPLIKMVVDKLYKPTPAYDKEDLVQECYLALPKILAGYKDNMNIGLKSWVRLCLERRLYDIFKYYNRRKMNHINETEQPYNSNHETVVDVADLIDKLTPERQKLIKDYYWEGKSFITIAAEQRKYKSTIHGKYNTIINQLKEMV